MLVQCTSPGQEGNWLVCATCRVKEGEEVVLFAMSTFECVAGSSRRSFPVRWWLGSSNCKVCFHCLVTLRQRLWFVSTILVLYKFVCMYIYMYLMVFIIDYAQFDRNISSGGLLYYHVVKGNFQMLLPWLLHLIHDSATYMVMSGSARFICWFWCSIYFVVCLLNFLLIFFLIYLLLYLPTSSTIGPLHLQSGVGGDQTCF